MKKHSRRCRAEGGDISAGEPRRLMRAQGFMTGVPMSKNPILSRSHGGGISAKEIACGRAAGVRSGSPHSTPAQRLARGEVEGHRNGPNAKLIGMGRPAGRRGFATGGHATDMGFEPKGERLRKVTERNNILGSPHYAVGGEVHSKMRDLYEALHGHFENEPYMKKLHATKEELYEGEPHRYKRARGGKLWVKNAFNPEKKGALHKALHVPLGKKIPLGKLEKAEHSKSRLMRKRANLAERARHFEH